MMSSVAAPPKKSTPALGKSLPAAPAVFATPLSPPVAARAEASAFRPEELRELSADLHRQMSASIAQFEAINLQTQILSINASIEASRAGDAGRSFAIVANEMKDLSRKTSEIAHVLNSRTQVAIERIEDFSKVLGTQVRGTRLADLALTNVDLIDRNLYERTCDVRWWATDSSLTAACAGPTPENLRHATQRMGVILDAYTVYFDLVLCDLEGRVIANGRPRAFSSVGTNVAGQAWFREAVRTTSGDEFGFEGVHLSKLVNGQQALVYSCGVRENGTYSGALLGVLGVVFNWDSLAGTIVRRTPLPAEEMKRTRVCIVDESGLILADTAGRVLARDLGIEHFERLREQKRGFVEQTVGGRSQLVACARAPGFETYSTGWYAVIVQELG